MQFECKSDKINSTLLDIYVYVCVNWLLEFLVKEIILILKH